MVEKLSVAWRVLITTLVIGSVCGGTAYADTGEIIEGPPNGLPESVENGWQAGVCTTDSPHCSVETPSQFYTPAAGHPGIGFTQFIVKHTTTGPLKFPVGQVRNLRVDLPVGLSINPQATPWCSRSDFEGGACAADTQVGESELSLSVLGVVAPPIAGLSKVPVYNLEPDPGHPALFAFTAAGQQVYLQADVDWSGNYHEGFTIAVPKSPLGELLINRLIFDGRAGDGTFLTNPSTCLDPALAPNQHVYSTFLRADSVEAAKGGGPNPTFPEGSTAFESPLPTGVGPTGCDRVPFEPTVVIDGNGATTDSPSGLTVRLTLPFAPEAEAIANSNVRTAAVALPPGTGLNPASAPSLSFCTDAQFGKGTAAPIACPSASKIGTAAIESPPLPAGSLMGAVYLGTQQSREPQTGEEYRIFVDAVSARFGVDVRLVGDVVADPRTGALTAVFKEDPQLPFTSFDVSFDKGLGVLSSPPICQTAAASTITPWSGTPPKNPTGTLTLTQAPGGQPCAKTMAERPFQPVVTAGPASAKAGTYTPFDLRIGRTDGQQELKGFHLILPAGATAKLAGIPYCLSFEYAAAIGASGSEEQKKSSCDPRSQIGTATVLAGTGPTPLKIAGKAYLSGPFQGAPLSIIVITPALAGPFDLGNVIVHAPLGLDPETAQVSTGAELPDVFGGATLDIRSVDVSLDRSEFTLNGTNCRAGAIAGTVSGGGADPTNRAAWSGFPVSVPFQAQSCDSLGFEPRLKLRLFGQTRRAKHPRLKATLLPRPGQANIALASVALPHSIFLDQASLGSVCTRPQFAAGSCPAKSRYGYARAFTPLLSNPLEGPVYLRSSHHKLPDLVADLKGQVNIVLDARIDSFKGGIRTSFESVPDVPVSKFILNLPGGKHGLLQASTNLCTRPVVGIVRLSGQNGAKHNFHKPVGRPCAGRKAGPGHRHKASKHPHRPARPGGNGGPVAARHR